jgi:hypothetical protein
VAAFLFRELYEVFLSQDVAKKEICEVAVQKGGSDPVWVQIEAIGDSSGGRELCYAKVDDITSRKSWEQSSGTSKQ